MNNTKIVNIVSSSWVCQLDIITLAKALPRCIYEPDTFAGLVYRRKAPDCTVIMFASGRMVSTGVKSIKDVKSSIYTTVFEIEKIFSKKCYIDNLKIENIVAVHNLGIKLNLKYLFKKLNNVSYDSEKFPGMVYRNHIGKSVLIFSSGKLVFTGTKSRRELNELASEICQKIYNVLDDNSV
ncbi:MAG: TATA box-binding protein [Nitrosopumilus sp.]|nr:TATA box-binding protein [Nitrosopumilus sp.]MDA7957501.1 TATA box-binding protein [Nitrosopumilus sp.]